MTDDVRYERIVRAPAERVFDALLSAEGQGAFYGDGDPDWIVRSESDVRVGGVWTILFGESADRLYRHQHVFEVIDRPRRVVLSTTETRLDGTTLEFETEFVFERRDGATLLTMVQRGLETEALRDEHSRGVPNAFDRFERLF
jgi:uncharacterized protein YndB with AHSA1/START domain